MFKLQAARRTRKRSFLLFELLVSMALITLCLFPLVKPLAAMRRADRSYLENIQLERAAQNAFCLIKAKLYENKFHSWNQLGSSTSGELPDPFHIVMSKDLYRTYHCSYTIKRPFKDSKKPKLHKVGRVITIAINLQTDSKKDPIVFNRTLYLEKQI